MLPAEIDTRKQWIAIYDSDGWKQASTAAEHQLNQIIDSVSVGAGLDWWLSSPASRNPFISPLYHHLCVICYVDKLCRQNRGAGRHKIIVDSAALQHVIKKLLQYHGCNETVVIYENANHAAGKQLSLLRNILGHIVRYVILGFTRLSKSDYAKISVLVDTFVLKGWRGGDRYYGSSIRDISDIIQDKIWQVPEFLSSSWRELWEQRQLLLISRERYLFKESVLTPFDYYFAFRKALTRPNIPALMTASCCGQGISTLIEEELANHNGFDQTVRGWLNYRFFGRLHALGIEPKRIIDWFENQSIDKGWHKGVNEFFPTSSSIGYQAFPDLPGYFCMFPTKTEQSAKVLPPELAVMGNGYIQSRGRYLSTLPIVTAPAFRFRHLWRDRGAELSGRRMALICLPIDGAIAISLLRCVLSLPHGLWELLGLEPRIRPHPACPIHALDLPVEDISYFEERINSGELIDAIDNSRILIGTMSSTCLEALVRYVPVMVYQGDGNNFNPIPSEAPKSMVAYFSNAAELEGVLSRFIRETQIISEVVTADIDVIRSRYFSPVVDSGVMSFFGSKNLIP